MECVKESKKKYIFSKFREINNLLVNIDSFDKYSLNNNLEINKLKNQLFTKEYPPFKLIKEIFYKIINKELDDEIYYEFSRKNLLNKNIIEKVNEFVPELKKYYLKCKHKKYLENLNEKKIITLFRQLLKPYDFSIDSVEKYNNGEKFLLYTIEKKKNLFFKKINSVINFD
jgi:hypothetical protein